ncbi:uncharacterized protein LOC124151488 [Haliotis rufescens]|uniref:uncharacterized protein LOC124151488 n=1 Tax=Haliotis rufescens TaxID=6454 RepID=UPI001EB05694|nr:uncharacterized protein LOC124151488 [Haliotis rufescens]XP_046379948.1 uncharacterized protein LOC124151488 [Haliotis rufescens]
MSPRGYRSTLSVPLVTMNNFITPIVPSSSLRGFTGMPTKHVHGVQHVFLLITTCLLMLTVPTSGFCDERCEKANPNLHRIKGIWSNSFRGQTLNFNEFIQYLISASGNNRRLSPLRDNLVRMIREYRDCVMACEHAFSKRSNTHSNLKSRKSQLCNVLFRAQKQAQTVIPKQIYKHCFSKVP